MSVMKNLLIAQQRLCEERRRYIADLESLAQRLRADAMRLFAEIDRTGEANSVKGSETTVETPSPLMARYGRLEASIAEIDGRLAGAREALIMLSSRKKP